MKCSERFRITSLPIILQHAGKDLVVASESECGESVVLIRFPAHYIDGGLFVATTRIIHFNPSCRPCTQQGELTGYDDYKLLTG